MSFSIQVDAMLRLHYMALDFEALCDDQHRPYFSAFREFVSTSLQHVGAAWRLALRLSLIPHDIPRHVYPCRVERASRNVGGGQHGGGRHRRVHSPKHIFQIDAGESSMATEHHCGGSTVFTP